MARSNVGGPPDAGRVRKLTPPSGAQTGAKADPRVWAEAAPESVEAPSRFARVVAHTLESFRFRHFRYLWAGSLLGMGGFQMQMIARTLLVDDLTGSALITSVVAMGFAPSMLIMSLFGGVAGDRLERRAVIQVSQAAAAFMALLIGVLIALDVIHWVHLLFASVAQGVMFAFQMPSRQAIIPRIVGKENVSNAIALSSSAMGVMTIVGPAIAGFLYGGIGPEAVYFTVGGMSVLAVVVTGQVPRVPPEGGKERKSVFRDIASGFGYVRSHRIIFLLLVSSFSSALLMMPFRMQIPVFARRLYGIEPTEIGSLMAVMGVGAIIATGIMANLRKGHPRGMVLLLGGMGLSGAAMVLMAVFDMYAVGMAVMIFIGLSGSVRMALGSSLSIEATSDEFRARVMSLNMMTFGLMPLGALPVGWSIDEFGAQAALLGLGAITLVVAVLFVLLSPSLRRLD